MEVSKIIENLDSLWFFSNILLLSSSPPPPSPPLSGLAITTDEKTVQPQVLSSSPKSSNQQPPPTEVSKLKTVKFQLPIIDNQVNKSLECGSGIESEIQEMEVVPVVDMNKKKMMKMKRGERIIRRDERKMDFRYGVEITGNCILIPVKPKSPKYGTHYLKLKMPPLSDTMAMKKHLKLWAHAVADFLLFVRDCL